MDDSTSDNVSDFDPVASAFTRHDGWAPERQRIFIHALGKIGMVSAAAAAVGMSRKSAYALLRRAGPDSSFARAWRDAQSEGRCKVSLVAIDRALNGVEIPYFYRGIQRATRRVYDDRLLIAALRAAERAADRTAGAPTGAGNAGPAKGREG